MEKEITRVEKGGKMGLKDAEEDAVREYTCETCFWRPVREVSVRSRKRNNKLIRQVLQRKQI